MRVYLRVYVCVCCVQEFRQIANGFSSTASSFFSLSLSFLFFLPLCALVVVVEEMQRVESVQVLEKQHWKEKWWKTIIISFIEQNVFSLVPPTIKSANKRDIFFFCCSFSPNSLGQRKVFLRFDAWWTCFRLDHCYSKTKTTRMKVHVSPCWPLNVQVDDCFVRINK